MCKRERNQTEFWWWLSLKDLNAFCVTNCKKKKKRCKKVIWFLKNVTIVCDHSADSIWASIVDVLITNTVSLI